MGFEGKHSYFKDLTRKIKNFKNLPLSLAKRHQSIECSDSTNIDGGQNTLSRLSSDLQQFGKVALLEGHDDTYAHTLIRQFYNPPSSSILDIVQYSFITINGTQYKPGSENYLITGFDDLGLTEFGTLLKYNMLLMITTNYLFAVMVIMTVGFSEELNAYQITEPENAQGCDVLGYDDLPCHKVYHTHKRNTIKYILYMVQNTTQTYLEKKLIRFHIDANYLLKE